MTTFWIVCAALLIVALPFVVLPLWRNTGNNGKSVLRDAANLEILPRPVGRTRSDLRNGLLTQDAYEQGKRELQARLLEEVKTAGQPAAGRSAIRPRCWRSCWRYCCRYSACLSTSDRKYRGWSPAGG